MSTRRPPAAAIWLLDRLGYTARNPPLAGDLMEAFHHGRSRGWYWRQTLSVLATGCGRNLVSCRRFLLPLCAGFAVQAVVVFGLWRFSLPPKSVGWDLVLGLMTLALAIKFAQVRYDVIGRAHISLPRLLTRDDMQEQDRRVVNRLFAGEIFFYYLVGYCVVNCFAHLSPTELAGVQGTWFVIEIVRDVLWQTLTGQWPASRG